MIAVNFKVIQVAGGSTGIVIFVIVRLLIVVLALFTL